MSSDGKDTKRLERAAIVAWNLWYSDPWEKEHPLVKAEWIAMVQAAIESSDQKDFFDRPPPDAAELAERAEWDVTLMDGIEPESFDQKDSVEGADERVL